MIKEEASGKFFNVDYVSFCKILKMVKPDIPPNQATHILRHTFASHFVMNEGNIIALQRIPGHANIQQTMTYAHLSPEYLQNAVALNPLAGAYRCKILHRGVSTLCPHFGVFETIPDGYSFFNLLFFKGVECKLLINSNHAL